MSVLLSLVLFFLVVKTVFKTKLVEMAKINPKPEYEVQ